MTTIEQDRMTALSEQMLGDLAAYASGTLVALGDRLGLWRAMAAAGPLTSDELAARSDCAERYVREWLATQAAGGYVDYDAANHRFELSDEAASLLADESSPAFLGGLFDCVALLGGTIDVLAEAFRTGDGFAAPGDDETGVCVMDRISGPAFRASLVHEWIAGVPGLNERLAVGGRVADIGCGAGTALIVLAEAFPRVECVGYDMHTASLDSARRAARAAGVAERVRFETVVATEVSDEPFDLVCMFDSLHDMGDPVGAASRVHEQLAEDGVFLLAEPLAADNLEDNFNALGRLLLAISTMACTPASLAQPGRAALGAAAGESRIRAVLAEAGFSRIRTVGESPLNVVLEVRP